MLNIAAQAMEADWEHPRHQNGDLHLVVVIESLM
jgi:hypothetical protein